MVTLRPLESSMGTTMLPFISSMRFSVMTTKLSMYPVTRLVFCFSTFQSVSVILMMITVSLML